jgi:hypothetical protein
LESFDLSRHPIEPPDERGLARSQSSGVRKDAMGASAISDFD